MRELCFIPRACVDIWQTHVPIHREKDVDAFELCYWRHAGLGFGLGARGEEQGEILGLRGTSVLISFLLVAASVITRVLLFRLS